MGIRSDILLIDDDKDLVNTVRIVLESKNYRVRTAYNGKEGYDRIEERRPDLIILDVMMATDTEGFDFAYKLRNNPQYQNIPIVMVTGFPQKMVEMGPEKFQHILGESWPVSNFLEKPVDPEQLLSVVEDTLREENKT
jgi:CheY-like chemotaxis protein